MKCPFKFGRYKFEGGEECHKDCAWRITDSSGNSACAVSALAISALGGELAECTMNLDGCTVVDINGEVVG